MREKIIEILKKWESCPFAGHSFLSAINSNNYPSVADEILALPLYSEEFIEWKDENVGYSSSEGKFWCSNTNKIFWFKTIDKLYEYWKNLKK